MKRRSCCVRGTPRAGRAAGWLLGHELGFSFPSCLLSQTQPGLTLFCELQTWAAPAETGSGDSLYSPIMLKAAELLARHSATFSLGSHVSLGECISVFSTPFKDILMKMLHLALVRLAVAHGAIPTDRSGINLGLGKF